MFRTTLGGHGCDLLAELVDRGRMTRPLLHEAFQLCIPLLAFKVEGVPALMILIQILTLQLLVAHAYPLLELSNGGLYVGYPAFRPPQPLTSSRRSGPGA